ncbi:MAG: hypothetical protein A2V77_07315 [Anaeromyxobacter sp. RBG_16_69_14]|nr:MAG: hypothetical protein A2V77_07315 [Anaeromyxobacter sp. RBG_16_69_14]
MLQRHIRIRRETARQEALSSPLQQGQKRRWETRRDQKKAQLRSVMPMTAPDALPQGTVTVGNYVGLCVLIRFPDVADTISQQEVINFCNQTGPGVNRILRRATGNDPSLMDDLHQETFQIAITKLRRGELRDPCRLPGFIASLARNLACEHFRRRPRFVDLKGDDMGAPTWGPLDLLLADERSRRIRLVLRALSSRDREVLERFYLHADSKERICRDLGLDSLQFNRVLFRARRRCRNLYELSSRDEEASAQALLRG